MTSHNMATTHPRLLNWFASKNPFQVFLKILPLLLVFGCRAVLSQEACFTIGRAQGRGEPINVPSCSQWSLASTRACRALVTKI